MCGIGGYISWGQHIVLKDLKSLVQSLIHRGPDSQEYWINNDQNIGLVHTRLSILDLSLEASQPMHAYNASIVLNGEIYNFIEIRVELQKKGYFFNTESDTEVVLASYREWGSEMLHKFNGMWAFAIYDHLNNNIFLSRDRFGVKPLYYYHNNSTFIFASEVKAIHKLLGPSLELNPKVINDILNADFNNHGTEETYLQTVKILPAGFSIELTRNKLVKKKWYELKLRNIPQTFNSCAEELTELIFDSCKIRLRSDVPVATCLSGGVDSGIITSFISHLGLDDTRFNKYSHRSFCASFPDTPLDEAEAATYLAEKIGSKLDILRIDCPTPDLLEESMYDCDGPMHALAFFPIWSLYKFIKENGITVTLDGQGPDEMLGGYNPLEDSLKAAIELNNPRWFFDVYKTYSAQGESTQSSSKKFAARTMVSVFKQKAKQLINHPRLISDYTNNLHPSHTDVQLFNNSLDQRLYKYFFQSPLPGILQQYDRCSMAHGVECRMPFMDFRIVEYIFSLPVEYKVGHGYTKRILRAAAENILPDRIRLNKTKIGFNAPVVDWFKGPLKEWMMDQMNSDTFIDNNFFDGRVEKRKFEKFIHDNSNSWTTAWAFWPKVHLSWWLEMIDKGEL
jgi:asparagine synthase (glutamine-hydrolysing)